MTDVRIPDSPVPVTGYRIWGVVSTADGPRLQSTAAGFLTGMPVWSPFARAEAACLARRDCGAAPDPAHGCGIHAFRHLDDALRWARAIGRHRDVVVGEIGCWGRVVESARGWRAQFAYPSRLYLPPDGRSSGARRRGWFVPAAIVARLASGYGVAPASAH